MSRFVTVAKTNTMKLTAKFLILLLLFASCNKDKVEPETPFSPNVIPPAECLIVGDSTFHDIDFVSYSPVIELNSHNSLEIYEIDMDWDGVNDFQLNVYSNLPFAGTWFKGTAIKIKSLHPAAEISMDSYTDSTFFYPCPLIYEENDTLLQQSTWGSGEFNISVSGDDPSDSCYSPGCPMVYYGPWFGQSNKYIGVRMCGSNLGWIKVSLPVTNVYFKQRLLIEQYGYDL